MVWFARREGGWESESERVLREQGIPVERLDPAAAARLFPAWRSTTSPSRLLEPAAGVLRAGRWRAGAGGAGARGRAARWSAARRGPTASGALVDGRRLEADHVVWACGGWLARALPRARAGCASPARTWCCSRPARSGPRRPSPAGSTSTRASTATGSIEPYGMKVASDREGEPVEPGAAPAAAAGREPSPRPRDYLGAPLPGAGERARALGARRCHYSLTADGNFLFARHPEHERVWLLGGGSGHGYKHGPAVAEHARACWPARPSPSRASRSASGRRRGRFAQPAPSARRRPARGGRRRSPPRPPPGRGWSSRSRPATARRRRAAPPDLRPERQRDPERERAQSGLGVHDGALGAGRSWDATTSIAPPPSRMSRPAMRRSYGGSCGVTSSRPRPRSGRTPSCWCTTGHSVP